MAQRLRAASLQLILAPRPRHQRLSMIEYPAKAYLQHRQYRLLVVAEAIVIGIRLGAPSKATT